jgi:hypothetical protein
MAQPPRSDPLAAAARVTGAARDLAAEVASGLRRTDRSLRLRAAALGTWLLLAMVSVWVACPGSGPSNSLGAVARLQSTSVGQVISVRNDSDGEIWTEVSLVLDGTWRYEDRRTMRPRDVVTPRLDEFLADGRPPPDGHQPRRLTISCRQGDVTLDLLAR